MTSLSANYNLILYDGVTDAAEKFLDFRVDIAGTAASSNMNLIDSAMADLQDQVDVLDLRQGLVYVNATYVSPSYYTASVAEILAYTSGMFIVIALDTESNGTVTLNINGLGTKTLQKISTAGVAVNFQGNELGATRLYTFRYNGTSWVWVDGCSADYVGIVGTAGNFIKVSADKHLEDSGYSYSTFAPAAQGVTNGNSHDHNGGDGGTIDHVNLNNKGTNTHSQIDSHIGSTSNPHSVTSQQVLGTGTSGQKRALTSGSTDAWIDDDYSITIVVGTGLDVIDTGHFGIIDIGVTSYIESIEILGWDGAAGTGSIVIDLRQFTYAEYDGGSTHPVSGDSICASAKPTISSAVKATDSTLTGWTRTLSKGDKLQVYVDSVATFLEATLIIKLRKTATS